MAIEMTGVGRIERIEREAALALARQPILIGEQPALFRHARRLPAQHRRHRVLGQPVDFIFRGGGRHTCGDEPRMQRGIFVTGGEAFCKQGAFVGLGHVKNSSARSRTSR